MKMKAIAPWFGGKRGLAGEIVAELGPHTNYFEPFCGSMAVLFAKPPSRQETVNDLHAGVTALARVVADDLWAPRLYDRLQRTLVCEDLLKASREYVEGLAGSPSIEKLGETAPVVGKDLCDFAYWFFVASWIGRNGTAGTDRVAYQIAVRWTAGGGSPTVRFQSAVESIPAWHARLKNVVILRRDAFEILSRFSDTPETAVYVDSPYCRETRNGNTKNGGSGRYRHEFRHDADLFTGPDDHTRLRDQLSRFNHARVVVSHYDCQRVRELYRGWTFVEHARQKNLHVQNRRGAGKQEAPEVLILNGPSYRAE